jgi:iron complex outermembrane receptor protein
MGKGTPFTVGASRVATAVILSIALSAGFALAAEEADGDLTELSLEELMNIEVYSVSKRGQALTDAPAAIYVLTQEDIHRSGATSIPEVLRFVPGLEVAHIDANTWAITSRGFNDRFANKLLVLIDGRSVYTPLFAGVYWDVPDVLLDDIDRIEVIRGPGGTLWGANAVNGVINIITKSASETQGMLLSVGGGTEERAFSQARFGGKIGEKADYRIYGKYYDRQNFDSPDGGAADDDWNTGRGGFRIDSKPSDKDELMLTGDFYTGERDNGQVEPQLAPPYATSFQSETDVNGGHMLARWTRDISDDVSFNLQAYYDRTERDDQQFKEDRDTIDVEWQNDIHLFDISRLSWGLGYRWTNDSLRNEFTTGWDPGDRETSLFSGFIQNQFSLLDDRLQLTVGTKVEHNHYTGWELQPSGRFLAKPADKHTIWGAISRAVRTPSRAENDVILNTVVLPPGVPPPGFPGAPNPLVPTVIQLLGDSGYDSEDLLAYELGYRAQIHESLSLDIATYYNDYNNLRTVTLDPNAPVEPLADRSNIRFLATNKMRGQTWGVELAMDWLPLQTWRVRAGYSYFDIDLHLQGSAQATDGISKSAENASPHNTAFIRNMVNLPYNLDFDTNLRYVDAVSNVNVSSYVNLDARLAWKPRDSWEFAVVGQNLLEHDHKEYGSSAFVNSQYSRVPRGVYFQATFKR